MCRLHRCLQHRYIHQLCKRSIWHIINSIDLFAILCIYCHNFTSLRTQYSSYIIVFTIPLFTRFFKTFVYAKLAFTTVGCTATWTIMASSSFAPTLFCIYTQHNIIHSYMCTWTYTHSLTQTHTQHRHM